MLSFLSAVGAKKSDDEPSDFSCRNKRRGCKGTPTHSLRTAMPTVWGFVAILQIGVVISDVCEIRRRYYGNRPDLPRI